MHVNTFHSVYGIKFLKEINKPEFCLETFCPYSLNDLTNSQYLNFFLYFETSTVLTTVSHHKANSNFMPLPSLHDCYFSLRLKNTILQILLTIAVNCRSFTFILNLFICHFCGVDIRRWNDGCQSQVFENLFRSEIYLLSNYVFFLLDIYILLTFVFGSSCLPQFETLTFHADHLR